MKGNGSIRIIICGLMLSATLTGIQPVYANQDEIGFNGGPSVSDNELSGQSGQGGGSVSVAIVSGNTININGNATLNNGDNVLGDHALDNVSGISSVIQNSGNNVVIQNSTIVNVSFE